MNYKDAQQENRLRLQEVSQGSPVKCEMCSRSTETFRLTMYGMKDGYICDICRERMG